MICNALTANRISEMKCQFLKNNNPSAEKNIKLSRMNKPVSKEGGRRGNALLTLLAARCSY